MNLRLAVAFSGIGRSRFNCASVSQRMLFILALVSTVARRTHAGQPRADQQVSTQNLGMPAGRVLRFCAAMRKGALGAP